MVSNRPEGKAACGCQIQAGLVLSQPGYGGPTASLERGGRADPMALGASGDGGLHLARCQLALVPAGSFASTLPTYQQSEVMVFIMNKVPLPSSQQPIEAGKAG